MPHRPHRLQDSSIRMGRIAQHTMLSLVMFLGLVILLGLAMFLDLVMFLDFGHGSWFVRASLCVILGHVSWFVSL
jgi:hypothetical protein